MPAEFCETPRATYLANNSKRLNVFAVATQKLGAELNCGNGALEYELV